MPAAGSKGMPKIPGELKDDTSASREEKKVMLCPVTSYINKMSHLSFCMS